MPDFISLKERLFPDGPTGDQEDALFDIAQAFEALEARIAALE